MVRLLMGYGLGAWLVIVPVQVLDGGLPVDAALDQAIAAVVAGNDAGFVLARDGRVTRVGRDGGQVVTASLGSLGTPFGTAIGGRVVFGGVRDGEARVVVLGPNGRVERVVVVVRAPRLDGVTLAGRDGETLWLGAAGRLFAVDVPSGAVVDELPWEGGEPCVLEGVVHNLVADDALRLDHVAWHRGAWHRAGPSRTMTFGENAYCGPDGYEIRSVAVEGLTPVTSSVRHRYQLQADGSLLDVTDPARPLDVGVTVPGVGSTAEPPPLQVDDSGSVLFWCAAARCAVATRSAGRPGTLRPWANGTAADRSELHHYNLCSAACGDGARPHTRDVVVWLVEQRRPDALSLNEACYDDVAALADRFPSRASYTALATASGCPGAVKSYGNHLLARLPGKPWSARFPTQSAYPCGECRGVACLTTERGVLCSAHLESPRHGRAVAAAQAREYLALVAGAPTAVLAGDFNLHREAVDAVLGPAGYHAPAVGPTIETRQIDMIYSDTAARATGETYCDPQASDHCYVVAG